MTEKEYRKIVFESEITNIQKQIYIDKINYIEQLINDNLPNYLCNFKLQKLGSLKTNLLMKNDVNIEINISFDLVQEKNLNVDTLILNYLHNLFLLNLDEEIIRKDDLVIKLEKNIAIMEYL